MKYETDVQKIVVASRVKDGYEVIGQCVNIDGVGCNNIIITKGKHKMAINALGYDSTYDSTTFKQEVR